MYRYKSTAIEVTIAKVCSGLRDASTEFLSLSKDEKNQTVAILFEKGISQKQIASSLGISAPAVSQRLKRIRVVSDFEHTKTHELNNKNLQRILELFGSGFSNKAITALLQESGLNLTEQEISSFFKVFYAVSQKLNIE